jgi:selenocysteine lyase/cysteine desulfurase
LGTFPTGSVRISMGVFHQQEDVEYLVNALQELSKGKKL